MATVEATATPDVVTQKKNARPPRKWVAEFLEALVEAGCVTDACKAAGINRRTAYQYRDQDAKFAKAWEEAKDAAIDQLEREAYRRAFEGDEVRRYNRTGKLVDTYRKKSDVLLIFLLKGALPHKYRDNVQVAHTGPGGGPLQIRNLQTLDDGELDRLEQLVAKVSTNGNGNGNGSGQPASRIPGVAAAN